MLVALTRSDDCPVDPSLPTWAQGRNTLTTALFQDGRGDGKEGEAAKPAGERDTWIRNTYFQAVVVPTAPKHKVGESMPSTWPVAAIHEQCIREPLGPPLLIVPCAVHSVDRSPIA